MAKLSFSNSESAKLHFLKTLTHEDAEKWHMAEDEERFRNDSPENLETGAKQVVSMGSAIVTFLGGLVMGFAGKEMINKMSKKGKIGR